MSKDTIYRQEAIDAVIDELKRIPTNAIRAKTRLEELPSAQRWIPCSERLPEDGKEVYVTSGKGRWAYTTEGKFSRRFGGWVTTWDNGDLPDVVAWMPLPEPYGGEQDE